MTGRIETDVLIAGGGLSGLHLASLLQDAGRDFHLVEARDRFGGRVLSQDGLDLGPAWFWPGQPRMAALAARFRLPVFEQYGIGAFRFEDAQGRVQHGTGLGSMQGSLRISGGMGALTDHIVATLPQARLHRGARVVFAQRNDHHLKVELNNGQIIIAGQVVLALPPRLVARIGFTPPLPAAALDALQTVPTWMAGQAKAIALYDRPFWRDEGLSGDAMSPRGPMVEIHDASPEDGQSGALFGFIGVPARHRTDHAAMSDAIRQQLERLFGRRAGAAREIILKDWAREEDTAVPADHAPLTAHPRYGLPPALQGLWGGDLLLSGSETASGFGGYLEGALEAAEVTFDTLTRPGANRVTA